MLRVLTRILGGRTRNYTVIGSEPSAAIWRWKTGRSRIMIFANDFLAAEFRAWRGEEPRWKVFWVYGVVTSVVIGTLYVVTFYDDRNRAAADSLTLLRRLNSLDPLLGMAIRKQHTKEKLWGTVARFLTVAWAGNVILVLTFLQLGLLIKLLFQHKRRADNSMADDFDLAKIAGPLFARLECGKDCDRHETKARSRNRKVKLPSEARGARDGWQ